MLYIFLYSYDDYVVFKRKGMIRYHPLCLPQMYTSLQSVVIFIIFNYDVFVVRRTQREYTLRPLLHIFVNLD